MIRTGPCLWWSNLVQWCRLLGKREKQIWAQARGREWREKQQLWFVAWNCDESAHFRCIGWSRSCNQGSRHIWQSSPPHHCNTSEVILKSWNFNTGQNREGGNYCKLHDLTQFQFSFGLIICDTNNCSEFNQVFNSNFHLTLCSLISDFLSHLVWLGFIVGQASWLL